MVSNLEQGKAVPNDPTLEYILRESGFDMTPNTGSGAALLGLLQAIPDNEGNLQSIEDGDR